MFRARRNDYDVGCPRVPPRPAVPGGLQRVVAVARRNLRSLQHFPHDDLLLLATIPSYPDTSQVELSKEVWQSVNAVVGLESVRPQWPVASGLFPTNHPAAAATDQLVLLPFIIIRGAGLGGPGAQLYGRLLRHRPFFSRPMFRKLVIGGISPAPDRVSIGRKSIRRSILNLGRRSRTGRRTR